VKLYYLLFFIIMTNNLLYYEFPVSDIDFILAENNLVTLIIIFTTTNQNLIQKKFHQNIKYI